VANAEPQTVKGILIAQLRDDVAQAIVPAMPAALLELGNAGRQVQFVMGHQDFFGFDPEEARKRRYSLAAAVHVGGGNQQTNILTLMREASGQAKIFAIGHQVYTLGVGDALNKKGPRVMPGLFVFCAWISQANDQFNGSHDRGPSFGVVDNNADLSAAKVDDKGSFTQE
jgi:hypothetical protein